MIPGPFKLKEHPLLKGEFEIHAPCVGVIAVAYGHEVGQQVVAALNAPPVREPHPFEDVPCRIPPSSIPSAPKDAPAA